MRDSTVVENTIRFPRKVDVSVDSTFTREEMMTKAKQCSGSYKNRGKVRRTLFNKAGLYSHIVLINE